MARFKIRLKLQGLEMELDGEREDLPLITAAVNKQFAALVEPAEVVSELPRLTNGNTTVDVESGKNRNQRRRASSRPAVEPAVPVDYRHDPARFGVPIQGWSIVEKCIWMLYVLQQTGAKEFTTGQIVATYNQHFKAAGKLHPPLVPRELQRAKVDVPTPVGEDKDRWYLTSEGEHQAEELVKKALGQK